MMPGWPAMRVLVTGAGGIVGSWLCEELIARGASVAALILDDDPLSRFHADGIGARCAIVRGNLASFADCMRAINTHEPDVIFHLGAQTLVGAALRDPLETFESNIRGSYNLLEAARRLAPMVKAFVVASSDKAYGDSPVLPYRETMPLNAKHPYDVSKSCTDMLASTYAHTYGMPVTIARCGNIFGGGDVNWSRIVPGTIRSLLAGRRPVLRSNGGQVRDYIYVRDVVDAYIALAEATLRGSEIAGEAFNFSPERAYTVLEIVAAIGAALDVVPDPDVRGSATMEIEAQTLDATKARVMLGWNARWDIADALTETVDWYRAHLPAGMAVPALGVAR